MMVLTQAESEGDTTHKCNASPYCTPTSVMIDVLSHHKSDHCTWHEANHVDWQEHRTRQWFSQLSQAQTKYLRSISIATHVGNTLAGSGNLITHSSRQLSHCAILMWLLHAQSMWSKQSALPIQYTLTMSNTGSAILCLLE